MRGASTRYGRVFFCLDNRRFTPPSALSPPRAQSVQGPTTKQPAKPERLVGLSLANIRSFNLSHSPPPPSPSHSSYSPKTPYFPLIQNTLPQQILHIAIMSGAPATKFKVADLSLAAFGRKEIELAEVFTTPHLKQIKKSSGLEADQNE